jgi:pseudouridine-5'-phosphate glycosidase
LEICNLLRAQNPEKHAKPGKLTIALPVPIRLDSPEVIADLIRAREALGLGGGILVANPAQRADEIPLTRRKVSSTARSLKRDAVVVLEPL